MVKKVIEGYVNRDDSRGLLQSRDVWEKHDFFLFLMLRSEKKEEGQRWVAEETQEYSPSRFMAAMLEFCRLWHCVSYTLLILDTMATPRLTNCLHLFTSVSVCGNIRLLSLKWRKNCKILRSNMSKSSGPRVCTSDILFDSLEEDVSVKQHLQSPNTWRWKQIWFPKCRVSLVEFWR